MKYFLLGLRNYALFSGRSNRSEYWYFALFYIVFAILAVILDNVLGLAFYNSPYGFIYVFFALALFLPCLAVTVRRLHDLDKSGWWILIDLIPLVGPIWLLVLLASEGTKGDNRFGSDPNGAITFDFESHHAQGV